MAGPIATIAVLAALLFHPVGALDDWWEAWTLEAVDALTIELVAEYTDLATRHPVYFGRPSTTLLSKPRALVVWTGTVEQWRPLIERYFAPADVGWAMRVMSCESGGNPNAKNPAGSASGLFQHLAAKYWTARAVAAGWAGADVFDPEANVAVAAWLYYHGGPSHWVCK